LQKWLRRDGMEKLPPHQHGLPQMTLASRLVPAPNTWPTERVGLPPAIATVAYWLDQHLPEGWEIHVRPPLNGLVPDLVVLHPQHGAAVYAVEEASGTDVDGDDFAAGLHAIHQKMRLCLDELANAAGLVQGRRSPMLHAQRIRASCVSPVPQMTAISVLAQLQHAAQELLPSTVAAWRRWLRDDRGMQTEACSLGFSLTRQQRDLVANAAGTDARRILGAAGSGKSVVLAGRAAHLAAEGKRVLLISFNSMLPAYMMDLAVKQSADPKDLHRVTAMHFHAWVRRLALTVGEEEAYRRVAHESVFGNNSALVAAAHEWVSQLADHQRWDALIVDEGQDIWPEWWNLLRSALRKDRSEILLACDPSQNIYSVNPWTDAQMSGCGFRGPWLTLESALRMPPSLCKLAKLFLEQHLPGVETLPPDPPVGALEFGVRLAWDQVAPVQLAHRSVAAMLRHKHASSNVRANAQVVCLVSTEALGLLIVEGLRRAGEDVTHTFGIGNTRAEKYADSMRRKRLLRPGKPGLVVTTIHSFKGWESCSVVVAVPADSGSRSRMLVYTAMTRLRNDPHGAALTVVCVNPALARHALAWPMVSGESPKLKAA